MIEIVRTARYKIPPHHALHSRAMAFSRWVPGPFLDDMCEISSTVVGVATRLIRSVPFMCLWCYCTKTTEVHINNYRKQVHYHVFAKTRLCKQKAKTVHEEP